MCLFAPIFRKGGHPIMPKTRLQNIIFTLIMAFVMVYAMVCYNIALDKGGMTNEIFLLAFHEIPIMWPIACILEYFVVEKLSQKLAFRMISPEDKPIFITLATMFIKQHSVFDVLTAFVMAAIMYTLVYRYDLLIAVREFRNKRKAKPQID